MWQVYHPSPPLLFAFPPLPLPPPLLHPTLPPLPFKECNSLISLPSNFLAQLPLILPSLILPPPPPYPSPLISHPPTPSAHPPLLPPLPHHCSLSCSLSDLLVPYQLLCPPLTLPLPYHSPLPSPSSLSSHFISLSTLPLPLPPHFSPPSHYSQLSSSPLSLPSSSLPSPLTIVETLNRSLWYNSFLNSNNDTLFLKSWSNKGINKIKHIINEHRQFLSHNQLKDAYNINTPFLTTIQIRSTIPKAWKELLRQFYKKHINISSEDEDIIHLVNKEKALNKITCADFYWHLIETKNINQIT